MADIVRLENIDKFYGDKIRTQVLFDINLSFEENSFNSIIGQSGSGKSTLLNLVGTLDKPTDGRVFINDQRTDTMNGIQLAELRNRTMGFIFQFHYLLPEFTAKENVLMPSRIMNYQLTPEVDQWADELLELTGLTKVKNNMANAMSGGQQQRTAIARALINKPSIILADEPTGNLDSDTSESIYKLLRDINKEYGTTFIIITHDQRIAEKTDRIIELKDGKVNMDVRR
ncbi:ABC transporter ATP-binding protein [Gudongella sp. DL1XJH-153]|uniref:ABC transporter ATP-binding protein n=1 Tax=Gudongella sp. DL1XJH-153 TaxID=3409804 RepID=UPI003BB60949